MSYIIPSTQVGYKGYYHYSPPSSCQSSCDLHYAHAQPKYLVHCWSECQTKECYDQCVVNNSRRDMAHFKPSSTSDPVCLHRKEYYH